MAFHNFTNRGIQRILIMPFENSLEISKTIITNTNIQKCVVHQIKNSTQNGNYKKSYDCCNKIKKMHRVANLNPTP